MGVRVHGGGLVIAGIGFFLTRFTVTLALYENPVQFYLAGVVPLVLGLGLAAFGVALAVAEVDASLVRTTAAWCAIGAVAMLVLVVLTLFGSTPGGMPDFATIRSRTYLSNFLIGGSVFGALTGLYAARNRRHRVALRHQANRLEVLNRLLRHEVLNALTVIRGYATLDDVDVDVGTVIEGRSDAIEATIDEVQYLTRGGRPSTPARTAVDLTARLDRAVRSVRDAHPTAEIQIEAPPDELSVSANERLTQVFVNLLENAVVHSTTDDPAVRVTVTATPDTVRVAVRDDGPGLPESKRALLETGEIEHFDNPGMGFGLNVVRLLVESYRGSIATDVGDGGTTITVALLRAGDRGRAGSAGLAGVGQPIPTLFVTLVAAMLAGGVYGVVSGLLGGSIAGIGVFYGTVSPVVGWITHEFHSAVFAFVFAGLVSLAPAAYQHTYRGHLAIGIGWSLALWMMAAGIVAPIWLRLLGIPASIPNLSAVSLASHLAWGISLALFTVVGHRYVTPWVSTVVTRREGPATAEL